MDEQRLTSNRAVLALAGLMALGLTASNAGDTTDLSPIVNANNAFAVDLYDQLEAAEGNLFFSPYSISVAFGMAGSGAGGNTADQMGSVLHFDGKPVEAAAGQGALQRLLNGIQSKGNIQLAIANSIWPERSYPFRKNYLDVLDGHFDVSASPCDFKGKAEAERQRINRWVEEQTNDRIKDLMPEGSVSPMTRLVLANAVYFKGDWAEQFKASATKDTPFFTAEGVPVTVPMMMQKKKFRYAQHPGLKVLSMPYAGGDLSMLIVLPDTNDGLAKLESELSAEKLEQWTDGLRQAEVLVHFPKFKAESSFQLNRTMQALGMTDAFHFERADFSGMTDRDDLYLSDAVHKAFIEVNEEGTEAAAATGIGFRAVSLELMHVFRADHPFLYLIRHESTGSILFMGRMTNPTK